MDSLFPFGSESRPEPGNGARVVGIGEKQAGEVFEALSSQTTREIINALYAESGTASEVAERVDVSLQNAKYHLDKLQDAGLIEVADTWYSEQGTEMNVYSPTTESVVILVGDKPTQSKLRNVAKELVGALGILSLVSLVVSATVSHPSSEFQSDTQPSFFEILPTVEMAARLSPSLLFFAGGIIVLLSVVILALVESSDELPRISHKRATRTNGDRSDGE